MTVRILEASEPVDVVNRLGLFRLQAFLVGEASRVETHLTLCHGELAGAVPTRVNSACLTSEAFGDDRCDCAWQMWRALEYFVEAGQGVLTYHPSHEGRGAGLFQKLRSYALMDRDGLSTAEAFRALGEAADSRSYEAAAVLLRYHGVGAVELFSNNPDKKEALVAAGIEVVSEHRVVGSHNPQWHEYLLSKAEAFGHQIAFLPEQQPRTLAD